jgi:hypothetical protein
MVPSKLLYSGQMKTGIRRVVRSLGHAVASGIAGEQMNRRLRSLRCRIVSRKEKLPFKEHG